MNRSLRLLALLALSWLLSLTPTEAGVQEKGKPKPAADAGPRVEEQVFDFGQVGIDFTVFHTFHIVNTGSEPFRITGAKSTCDCSSVTSLDSIVNPGDTAFFKLTFSTKDFYGPTRKSFTVSTDHPAMPKVKFSYLSQVEQWLDGLKPEPISLFFLPTHREKKVTIRNDFLDEIRVAVKEQFDDSFDVTLAKDRAKKGSTVQLVVSPRPDLGRGTHRSSLTLKIEKKGIKNLTFLTIPIEIVRY